MPSFKDLLEIHKRLDELFLEHQRALLRMNIDRAETLLHEYEFNLVAHMRDEEALMLPLYGERVGIPLGGAVEIFHGEHEKLRQYLALFQAELHKIKGSSDREGAVLFLLDSQHLFKRLLVHHDNREKTMLYPLLDEVTTVTERSFVFAQIQLTPRRESTPRSIMGNDSEMVS
jgi:hypothetical protein